MARLYLLLMSPVLLTETASCSSGRTLVYPTEPAKMVRARCSIQANLDKPGLLDLRALLFVKREDRDLLSISQEKPFLAKHERGQSGTVVEDFALSSPRF